MSIIPTVEQIEACVFCAPIISYAFTIPPAELPRAMEIMRLTGLLYMEIHKHDAPAEARSRLRPDVGTVKGGG